MVRLVCGNCGRIERFESFEDAFREGWDTIDRFGYNACATCPGVSVYLPLLYTQQAREAKAEDPGQSRQLLERAAAYTIEFDPENRRED